MNRSSVDGYGLKASGKMAAQHGHIGLEEHAGMVSGNLKYLDTICGQRSPA